MSEELLPLKFFKLHRVCTGSKARESREHAKARNASATMSISARTAAVSAPASAQLFL